MRTWLVAALVPFLSSVVSFAATTEDKVSVQVVGGVAICDQEFQNCKFDQKTAENLTIDLTCADIAKGCFGDWNKIIRADDQSFRVGLAVYHDLTTGAYAVNAGAGAINGMTFFQTIELKNGNKLTDSVTLLGNVLQVGTKNYIPVIRLAPVGQITPIQVPTFW